MNGGEIHVRRWVATAVVVAALIGGVFLASGLRHWTGHEIVGAESLPVTVEHNATPVPLSSLSNGFASVLKGVLPAVVNISSSKVVKSRQQTMPFFNDPFFQQFFGDQGGGQMMPQREREQSLGSGVIITPDGTIITNNHVVDGATDIKVGLSDKREFTAKVIGTDASTDIAVLKINATDLPTMKFGDSSDLHVGDIVLAVGDPYGIGETATMGIVSATGRSLGGTIENYEDFIQTDASINPGNSGGALVNLRGNLIGINTAILSNGEGMGGQGGNEGIGFAIPIDMAHNVMEQLVTHGKVSRGMLGVYPQDVSEALAKQFGLSQAGGALVTQVEPGKPADKAGIQRGDIILKLNGQPVTSANDLRLRISQMAPGTNVKLEIERNGKTQDMDVTLGELTPDDTTTNQNSSQGKQSSTGGLKGVEVQPLTSDLSQRLQLPSGAHGVVITSVDPDSAAAAANLDKGDVIEEVNRKPVTSVDSYRQAIASAGTQPILLLVFDPQRGGPMYVVVQPQQ
ncbi:MAG TPA: DegQ family serine endoprotease [Candidatus Acidoferrales bacterium]|nr:DegQ family serine endoprotease [Candidatus Acidoferrales bacterium]